VPNFPFPSFLWIIAVALLVWVLYVFVELAKHVSAWPF
jgi:hypothetical protein